MQITEDHKKVLEWMSTERCYFYPRIEKETGIDRKRIKEIMLELKIAGYAYWSPVINDDWMINGSGHLLTDKGRRLQAEYGIEYKGDDFYY